MNTRHALIFTAAAFAASCINYTGLEGDGSGYTKPQHRSAESAGGGADASGALDASGGVDGGGRGTSDRCEAADADDGTSAAASLGPSGLDCSLRDSSSDWATAMRYCAGLGDGWRLASKGAALKISSSPNICRTPLSGQWFTWTRSCAGAGLAWYVFSNGYATKLNVDVSNGSYSALCVR